MVSTDYTSYAIVYSCSGFFAGALNVEFAWVLSRQAYVPGSTEALAFQDKTYAIIKQELPDFDLNAMVVTQQGGDCVYNI